MKALRGTVTAAFAEAWANRAGFWTQLLAMIVNDIAWVAFWVLFFRRVGTIHDWDSDAALLLLSALCTSAGLVLGVLSNARRVGRMAAEGDLDAALSLPVGTLPYLLVRRVDTTNLGDLVFGLLLFVIAGDPSVERFAIYVVAVICASTLLTGFLIAIGSLAFFAGRNDAGELGFNAMLMFAAYPIDLFAGAAKTFLYVVVPAAFVGAVPAKLVNDFDAGLAAIMIGAALAFAVAGWLLFRAGLRRYTSGAVWTRA